MWWYIPSPKLPLQSLSYQSMCVHIFSCSSPADKDLLFVDMDIDTKPEDIKFESRATPNGELVYSEDPTKRVSEFTQQDIYDRKILFKHKGSNFGRILIWVNDGQLWVSTELKVRASAPFVEME